MIAKNFSIYLCSCCFFALLFLASCPFASGQVTGQDNGNLMEAKHYEELLLSLQPPKFWRERLVKGTYNVVFTGPGEDGVFPYIEVFGEEPVFDDLYEQRMLLRNRVRVKLLAMRADRLDLTEELQSNIDGRDVLEQLYSYVQEGRDMHALAYHFNGDDRTYTFLFTHSKKVFNIRFEFAQEVFKSIIIDGEEDNTLSTILFWVIVVGLLLGGFYYWFSKARADALAQDRILDVKTLERIELSKGFGDLVIGDEEADLDAPMDAETGFKILDLSARKDEE